MVFSTNQARHFYVATAATGTAVGTLIAKATDDKSHVYFKYVGKGGETRSDLIEVKNIIYAKAKDASAMARPLKAVAVTLDSDVNGGNPISGQDYILNISIRQFSSLSDESTYEKYGMVHAVKDMTASEFYKTLAISLAKNFSRELTKLLKFTLEDSEGTGTEVTSSTKIEDLTDTYVSLVIDEVEQDWVRGVKASVPVYFEVKPTTVTYEGDDVVWGKVETTESETSVGNGKVIADMEYFYMGERGDIYRNLGWPNVVPTEYMVDPTLTYHTLDIHYAYVGSNESVQKSEKDITIVCSDKTVMNAIITALNTASGLTIATLA